MPEQSPYEHGFHSKVIAVDFDNTIVTDKFPGIGEDIGAIPVLRRLIAEGHRIVLNTGRQDYPVSDRFHSGKLYLTAALLWLEENGIELYGVNRNPDYPDPVLGKVYADYYIDKQAVGCPLQYPCRADPYVDWQAMEVMLEHLGLFRELPR